MKEASGRLYCCARCLCQVLICGHCDRGNIYCGAHCANSTRFERQKLAAKRYQSSQRGCQKNAARQACYRIRQMEIVTHQGSLPLSPNVLLLPPPEGPAAPTILKTKKMDSCFFCNKRLHPALRMGFLHRDTRRVMVLGPAFPSGP